MVWVRKAFEDMASHMSGDHIGTTSPTASCKAGQRFWISSECKGGLENYLEGKTGKT